MQNPDPQTQAANAQTPPTMQDPEFSRRLCSGKIFSLNSVTVNVAHDIAFTNMSFSTFRKKCGTNVATTPILKNCFRPSPTVYAQCDQYFNSENWSYTASLNANTVVADPRANYNYASNFRSPLNGTLTVNLLFEKNSKKLRFYQIIVHFY
jgi:hypothetical protein